MELCYKQRFLPILLLLIISCSMSQQLHGADEEYVVVRLDEFVGGEDPAVGDATKFVKYEAAANNESNVNAVKVYPLGRPLQVEQSYLVSNVENVDPISRSIANITDQYVPEYFMGFRNSVSTAERIERFYLGLHYPVNNQLAYGIHFRGEFFGISGDESATSNLFELDLAAIYKLNEEFRLYGAAVLGSTDDVLSPGIRARAEYNNRGGIGAILSGELWVPWADNTIAAKSNGRSSGLNAEVTLPFAKRLNLTLNSSVNWRYAASDTFSVEEFQGTEIGGGGRLSWNFFEREYRQLPVEFVNREYFNFETVTSYFGVFASIQGAKYFGRGAGEKLIPVTEDLLDQRIGLSGAYAFNSHFGASAEVYIGYDPARSIDFGKLYGFDSRLVYMPTARLRLYGEFSLDSEAATGIEEGKTWYYGAGMNYKF